MAHKSLVRSLALLAPVVLAVGAAGCDPDAGGDPLMSVQSPIFGGTPDTTTEAVMAVIHQSGTGASASVAGCTGTTIAKVGASGILVTAGHCVVAIANGRPVQPVKLAPPKELFVVPGPDWMKGVSSSSYFGVASVAIHPAYDGSVDSPFDVAMIRYLGATAATPVIPALTVAEDTMAVNTMVRLVGYGRTETNSQNTVRRTVTRQISQISSRQFSYDQADRRGACEGDSGGPAFFQAPGGPRVAGVISFGDVDCVRAGVSVRVSSVASFIDSFMTGTPTTLTCEECATVSVATGNACYSQGANCSNPTTPCNAFLTCLDRCTTQSCATQCQTSMPSGAAAYDALLKCQCGGMCTAICMSNPACATAPPPQMCGGLTDARPACKTCITNTCCAEAAACGSDPTCVACQKQSAAGCGYNTLFTALNSCLNKCSGTPCAALAAVDGGRPADGGAGADADPTPDPGTTPGGGGAGGGGPPGATGGSGSGCTLAAGADLAPAGYSALVALAMIALAWRRRRR